MLAQFQRDAADRALELLRNCGGALLADEVGLGKSYVAAEVIRRWDGPAELFVPAALIDQWRVVLRAFSIEPVITSHHRIDPTPRGAGTLIVVDEAHAFRNPGIERFARLARAAAFAQVLLVTATPVCNSLHDLFALLRLFARDDLLSGSGVPSIAAAFQLRNPAAIERIVAELVIRRSREVLPEAWRFGELERHVVRHVVPPLAEIDALQFPLVGAAPILRKFLRRRLESSEAALLESIRRQLRFYRRALTALASGRRLPKRDYRIAFGHEEDREAFQEVLFWELFAPPGDAADGPAIRREVELLEQIARVAAALPRTKESQLIELLADREPTLVFTSSAATARSLHGALGSSHRTGLVTARERSRSEVLQAFTRGRLDVVISTDLSAEGLNLQRAGRVVHYDIPWNPVKLDQRNGRAWRIGQRRERVNAIYFLPAGRDTGIVETIARKNRERRRSIDRPTGEAAPAWTPTMRPRLCAGSSAVRLTAVCRHLPEPLARVHRVGLELIFAERLAAGDVEIASLVGEVAAMKGFQQSTPIPR